MNVRLIAAWLASAFLMAGCAAPPPQGGPAEQPDSTVAILLASQPEDHPAHFLVNPQGIRIVLLDGQDLTKDITKSLVLQPGMHHVSLLFLTRSHGSAYARLWFVAEAGHRYRALYKFSRYSRSVPIWIQDEATRLRVGGAESDAGELPPGEPAAWNLERGRL